MAFLGGAVSIDTSIAWVLEGLIWCWMLTPDLSSIDFSIDFVNRFAFGFRHKEIRQ